MKNRTLFILGFIFTILMLVIFLFRQTNTFQSKLEIWPMGDGKGIFVGESKSRYMERNSQGQSEEIRKRIEQHEVDVGAIEEAHRYRMQAYGFIKNGQLKEAAVAFEKAYAAKRHAVTVFDLADVYEKLGRYDDAITILDNMVLSKETNEYGIQKAVEIRARLLAAKAKP
ncbi:MAG: tetratricopeptide repeat protein [Candidatus Omnitrophota bacterium]